LHADGLAPIDPWEGAVRLFRHQDDPRLRREGMANALIESAPPGYPAVPAGVLDRDTAWTAFFIALACSDGGQMPECSCGGLDPQQAPFRIPGQRRTAGCGND
jgi:hypothetical protein